MDAGAYTGAGRPWQLVDELVTDVASPHTRNLLQQYRKESQVRRRLRAVGCAQRRSLTEPHWRLLCTSLAAPPSLVGYQAERVWSLGDVQLAP